MKQLKNSSSSIFKSIAIGIIVIFLVISNAYTLKLYLSTFDVDEEERMNDISDEISRAKCFIQDWYDELYAIDPNLKVYHNELQFQGGTYTLTVASDRIRAVYPRGERFFQLEYVTYIDFFIQDGHLSCRMYYNETGESVFQLN